MPIEFDRDGAGTIYKVKSTGKSLARPRSRSGNTEDLEMFNANDRFTESELQSIRIGGQGAVTEGLKKPELPFTQEEYRERIHRLRQMMAQEKIDLIFMTAPDSMCYFHGYSPSYYRSHGSTRFPPMTGTAIHVDHEAPVHFDFEQEEMLVFSTSIVEELHCIRDMASLDEGLAVIANTLSEKGWFGGTVGMEFWSHIPNRVVSGALEEVFLQKGCKRVVDATIPIRALRRIKSPRELSYIEEATRIADVGLEVTKDILQPGMTELEVYGQVLCAMTEAGGEPPAQVDVIQAGPYLNWHGFPSRRKIQKGELVMWDLKAVYNRYHSVITRGYFLGEPSPELVKLYRVAGKAYDLISDMAKAGTQMQEVCRALKSYYIDANIWDLREWCGGIEMGISMAPDWVGEVVWDVEEETEGVFQENEVTYYFGALNTLQCDVFIYQRDKARRLSSVPLDLIIID